MSYLKRKVCFSCCSAVLSVFSVRLETVWIFCRDLCVRCFYPRSSAPLTLPTSESTSHFTLQVDADLLKTSQMWRSRGGCHTMTHRRLVFVDEWKVSSCCGRADLPTKQIVLTLCRLLTLKSLKCFWMFYVLFSSFMSVFIHRSSVH